MILILRHITQQMKKLTIVWFSNGDTADPIIFFLLHGQQLVIMSPRQIFALWKNQELIHVGSLLFSQWGTAEGLIIGTNTDHLNSGTLMKHRLFDYFLKLKRKTIFRKFFNLQAKLHKHAIYLLKSSKHPLNLVRLSL
jgi:hypothetical protein